MLFEHGFSFLICRHIAELIFYMEELRAHVRKYGPVMQRYYVQYLSGFDAVVLNELVQVQTHSTRGNKAKSAFFQFKCRKLSLRSDTVLSCLYAIEPVCVSRRRVNNHVFICQHYDLSQRQTR